MGGGRWGEGDGGGERRAGEGDGKLEWETGVGESETRAREGCTFSFLESSEGIRLLGAFKAAPASPVLACCARQQP
jgi:hypothetical protein